MSRRAPRDDPTSPGTDLVLVGPQPAPLSAAGSPFQRPGAFGRRPLLAGLLGLARGTALDSSPLTSWTAHAAPGKIGDGVFPTQPVPYGVLASSELADDAFATSDILIGADAQILPFYNPFSQTVEALVFSASSGLNHLHRDPSQATGWAFVNFDLQERMTSVTSVAVAANNDRVYVLIFGIPDPVNNRSASLYWLTWLDDAVTWNFGDVAPIGDDTVFPPAAGPMKGGISREGTPYFYKTVVDGSIATLTGWVPTGDDSNPLDGEIWLQLPSPSTNTVQDILVLYDTAATNTVGYALVLTSNQTMNVYPQKNETFTPESLSAAVAYGVSELLWAWASPASGSGVPGYVVQGDVPKYGEGTFFSGEDFSFVQVGDVPEDGTDVIAVWQQNSQYTVNLLDGNGTLQTIQQKDDGTWAAPLPLTKGAPGSVQPGLVAVFGVPTDPTRSTLFAVGADESLSVLTLDDSGWTQTQLRQDNPAAVSITSYRVKIQIVDANGTPVRYASAQIGTDRPVGLWQDIGSTIITPAAPATMTADLLGEISFSVPAEELDTAVLTVQALDPTGQPSGPAATATADYDVRNFLGGTAALNSLGTLSGPTLQGAKNPDGSSLFPGLDSSGATALAGHLTAAITAGTGAAPAAGALRAYRLERRGKTVKQSTSRNPRAFGTAPRREVDLSISHLFDSIGHALRHDVATLESAVVRWAGDLNQWVVDLETDISGLVTYVINDMRDAFHIIGGWFSTLGADIVKGLNWLKREVFGFLSNVGANATTIENVLSQAPANLISIVNGIEKQVDGWFSQQETTVSGWIGELAATVEQATFGSSQPLTAPSTDTGSSTALNGLEKDVKWIAKVINDTPGKWLYDKLMQYLPQDPGPDLSGVFDTVINDLATVFTDSVDLASGIVDTLWDSFKDLTTPEKVTEVAVATWFNNINGVVQDVLKLCDAIADTVLDFVKAALNILEDYLNYQWSLTSISPILKLVLDRLGFDPTISLNRLVSLVLAFPLTLVREIRGNSPVFPVTSESRSNRGQAGGPEDTIASFFYTLATISQIVWTAADVVADLELIAEEGAEDRPQARGIFDYFDILCPIAENVFLLPGHDDALIWTGFPTDAKLKGLIAPAVLTGVLTPTLKIARKAKTAAGTGNTDPNVVQYYDKAPAEPTAFDQYYAPVLSCLAGLANTPLASIYSDRNSTSTGSIVTSILAIVLGNASNIASPFAAYYINKSLDDVPVLVKTVIDGVGGLGAGIAYAVSAANA